METCEHLTRVGLEEQEKREREVEAFRIAHTQACSSNQHLSVNKVKEFESLKQQVPLAQSVGHCSRLTAEVSLYS